MTERAYIVRPAVFAPAVLSIAAVFWASQESWWFLATLPFIWLGSVCAQPNLNLADGCLTYLAVIAGLIVMAFFKPLGQAILAGVTSGYLLSALEKLLRLRPAPDPAQVTGQLS